MIPAASIAKLAALGLSFEQAEAISVILFEVEKATRQEDRVRHSNVADTERSQKKRAQDRERQARHRSRMRSAGKGFIDEV